MILTGNACLGFAAFETPFAPCGGIAAVMDRLPRAMARVSGLPTAVVTPFFANIKKTSELLRGPGLDKAGSFLGELDGEKVKVDLLCLEKDGVDWLFLRPERGDVFAASPHPYRPGGEPLFRDALFFGAAARAAFELWFPGREKTIYLQDWQAATAALDPPPEGSRYFLTLHNTYDHPLGPGRAERAGFGQPAGETVLQAALSRVEHTVFTVSGQFARDILSEPFQTRVMAPHLQEALAGRLLGVDNGAFTTSPLPGEVRKELKAGRVEALLAWKKHRRAAFLAGLGSLEPDPQKAIWGRPDDFAAGGGPWFVMAGRDDPRQKGYEIAARSALDYLDAGGRGGFVFFPIPGDEGLEGLGFLEELSENNPARVLAFPFLYREGYSAAVQGADFGLMPSLYEPFGMANEIMLNGTCAIARATGGIVQQVVPLPQGVGAEPGVRQRAEVWHAESSRPTGLLYREAEDRESELEDWLAVNRTGYRPGRGSGNRLDERLGHRLCREMANALTRALLEAEKMRLERPRQYAGLIDAGLSHMEENFTWEKASGLYLNAAGVSSRPQAE